jgi:hypothetical protein
MTFLTRLHPPLHFSLLIILNASKSLIKCVHLTFLSDHPPPITHDYSINSQQISAHDHRRDLGVIMSITLSWNEHLKYILPKAYNALWLIRQSFCSTHNPPVKKMLYLCLVRPQLTYCSQVWRPRLLEDKTLEKVQCRAKEYILNNFSSDYKSRLVILPLMMQLELNDMLFFIRCLKELTDAFGVILLLLLSIQNPPIPLVISNYGILFREETLLATSILNESLVYETLVQPLIYSFLY